MASVGVIVNPAAGKDIRRVVAVASATSDAAKIGIVRRAVIGAVEGGATSLLLSDDRRGLAHQAIADLEVAARVEVIPAPPWDEPRNTTAFARRLAEAGAGAVIALGGDGTQRDVVKGWREVPLIPLSTGTNNVFPEHHEATIAGHAAGLVASGAVDLADVSWRAQVIDVSVAAPGSATTVDLALVDVALLRGSFTGSRAVWNPAQLIELVAAIAEPHSVGLSAIAGRMASSPRREAGGVHVRFGAGQLVRAPIAPGLYENVEVSVVQRMRRGDTVELRGPGTLSFDGERDVVLADGTVATAQLTDDGPRIIDVAGVLQRRSL